MNTGSRLVRCIFIAISSVALPVHAQKIDTGPRAVKPERLAHYWSLDPRSVEADVPNMARGIDAPTCAAISFVVEANGTTSRVKVQRIVPDSPLRGIAEGMGKRLRFTPTTNNMGRDRVFSWLIFPFNLPADPQRRTELMKPCAIDAIAPGDR